MITKAKLHKWLPTFLFVMLILQPLMDVASFWFQTGGRSTTPILLLRFAVLGANLLLAFVLLDKKKKCLPLLIVLCGLALCHMAACFMAGYLSPVTDLTNLIRIYQLPLMTGVLIVFLKENGDCFNAIKAAMLVNLLLIALIELAAVLTGTDPATYSDGCGYIGWFLNTNSQSAVLCAVCPLALAFGYQHRERWHGLPFWGTLVLGLFLLYMFSTRLAYLGLVAVGFGWAISLLIISKDNRRTALALALITVLFIGLYPFSELSVHLGSNSSVNEDRQSIIDSMLGTELIERLGSYSEDDIRALPTQEHDALVSELTPVYERFIGDFCAHFGVEKTMEMYHYSISFTDFSDVRHKKVLFARDLMAASPALSRWFGLELTRFSVGDNVYDVENDFHGVYFLCGYIGLAAMVLFILYFVWLVVWALRRDAAYYFTTDAAATGIALLMSLGHAVLTAGVLRRPNASIYLSVIFALIYYLVKLRPAPLPPDGTDAPLSAQ